MCLPEILISEYAIVSQHLGRIVWTLIKVKYRLNPTNRRAGIWTPDLRDLMATHRFIYWDTGEGHLSINSTDILLFG